MELARHGGVAVKGARVLVMGIAYKKNIEDTRGSALYALNRLGGERATCDYHDPYFPVMPLTRDHAPLAGRRSVELTPTLSLHMTWCETTDHSGVDYALVAESARLILDSRNVFHAQDIAVPEGRLVKI